MPRRNPILADNEIYHVFNRSVARENIFSSSYYLRKAFEVVNFYRFNQRIRLSKFKALPSELKEAYLSELDSKKYQVEIYCYAFMPNHFHFLLKQTQERGIRRFVSNFQNSFAKTFNLKNDRNGALFQNPFKAKHVESDEIFTHISRYIHLNPVTSYLCRIEELPMQPNTSYPGYVGKVVKNFVNTDFLLRIFGSKEAYDQFVKNQEDYQKSLKMMKDLILDR